MNEVQSIPEAIKVDFETLHHNDGETAEVVRVIHTVKLCGSGVKEDPLRFLHRYWSMDGKLLAETDTLDIIQEQANHMD